MTVVMVLGEARPMTDSKVVAQASVSLDGFIAGPGESGFDHLFAWCGNGDVEVPVPGGEGGYRVSKASADYVREMVHGFGALVVGRRQFDVTNGWNGRHPSGVPVFVVTHAAPPDWPHDGFTFVTGGIEDAVNQAKAAAGTKHVGIGPGSVVGQALDAGLVDELRLDQVPVLFGDGVRLVGDLAAGTVLFGPPQVIEGDSVTHLSYPVRNS